MSVTQNASGRRQFRMEQTTAKVVQVEDGLGFPFRNHQAEIEDLGIGGIGLKMRCAAVTGDRVRVTLAAPGSERPVAFNAVVRWREGEHFGLQWVQLAIGQQAWLRSQVRHWAARRPAQLAASFPAV